METGISVKNTGTQDCTHGYNVTRIFDVLPNFPFTTSEMKRDY